MPRKSRKAPPKRGRGIFSTAVGVARDTHILSNLAGHIPVVGPVVGSILGALGFGRRRAAKGRGRPVNLIKF